MAYLTPHRGSFRHVKEFSEKVIQDRSTAEEGRSGESEEGENPGDSSDDDPDEMYRARRNKFQGNIEDDQNQNQDNEGLSDDEINKENLEEKQESGSNDREVDNSFDFAAMIQP